MQLSVVAAVQKEKNREKRIKERENIYHLNYHREARRHVKNWANIRKIEMYLTSRKQI